MASVTDTYDTFGDAFREYRTRVNDLRQAVRFVMKDDKIPEWVIAALSEPLDRLEKTL